MSLDFTALLNQNFDDIKAPLPLPEGTYYGVVENYKFEETREKKTPYVRFNVKLTGAHESIDETLLEGVDLSKRSFRKDFFLTADATIRFKRFVVSLGIDGAGRSLGELMPEIVGQTVQVTIKQRPGRDPSEPPMNDIDQISGVQD
jgi:hypothetical protein